MTIERRGGSNQEYNPLSKRGLEVEIRDTKTLIQVARRNAWTQGAMTVIVGGVAAEAFATGDIAPAIASTVAAVLSGTATVFFDRKRRGYKRVKKNDEVRLNQIISAEEEYRGKD